MANPLLDNITLASNAANLASILFGKPAGGGTTSSSTDTSGGGTSTGTSTRQTILNTDTINAMLKEALTGGTTTGAGGLADVLQQQRSKGIYNSNVSRLMSNDLTSRVGTQVALQSAPTTTTSTNTSPATTSTRQSVSTPSRTPGMLDMIPGGSMLGLAGLGLAAYKDRAYLKKLLGLEDEFGGTDPRSIDDMEYAMAEAQQGGAGTNSMYTGNVNANSDQIFTFGNAEDIGVPYNTPNDVQSQSFNSFDAGSSAGAGNNVNTILASNTLNQPMTDSPTVDMPITSSPDVPDWTAETNVFADNISANGVPDWSSEMDFGGGDISNAVFNEAGESIPWDLTDAGGAGIPYFTIGSSLLQGDLQGAVTKGGGAYLGGTIGSAFGPVGTVVGSFLGSALGGSCFITTAILRALGTTDDNAPPLQVLRQYRDTWLATNHPEDIAEYYRIAPEIVSGIDSKPEAAAIWKSLYNLYLVPALSEITLGRPETAHMIYREMVYAAYGLAATPLNQLEIA